VSSRYKLFPRARSDLEEVWCYGVKSWGANRADKYIDELNMFFFSLTINPELHKERYEYNAPVRVCAYGDHIIAYIVDQDTVNIICIVHKRVDLYSVI